MTALTSPAEKIVDRALANGAGRICFLVEGDFVFAAPDSSEVAQVLTRKPTKYKFQRKSDGRWIDSSKYLSASEGAGALEAMRNGDLTKAQSFSPDQIADAARSDPRAMIRAIRGLSRHLTDWMELEKSSAITKQTSEFLDALAPVIDSPHLRYLRAIADLYEVMSAFAPPSVLDGETATELDRELRAKITADPTRFASVEAQAAANNILGKVLSTTDRDSAAERFRLASHPDTRTIIRDLYIDMGVMTYFDHVEVVRNDGGIDPAAIRASITPLSVSEPRDGSSVLVSVDSGFFRIYGPLLYYYAQQLPDVDYTIVICGTEAEARDVLASGDAFAAALDGLNRGGMPGINFYYAPLPDGVAEPKTYYASARFFAAQLMLERYQDVYLMDADLTTDVDPRPFLKRVAGVPFAGPAQRNFSALSPWRRYMAGNIHLSRAVLDTSVLEDLQAYLAVGLARPDSWMLDQNALSYAIERNSRHFTSLNRLDRPFSPPRFRSVWEKNFPR